MCVNRKWQNEKERGGYARSLRRESSSGSTTSSSTAGDDSEFLPNIGSVMSNQKVCTSAALSNSVVG